MQALGVLGLCFSLIGCTASWRAPVESRGSQPPPNRTVQTRPAVAPAPRPLSSATRASSSPYYRVQRGDTLFGIAWQNGVDYRRVAEWNGIRAPYRIYAGQNLRLRPPPQRRTPPATPAPPRQPAAAGPKNPTPPPVVQPPPNRNLAWRWPARGNIASTFKASDPLRKGVKIAGREGSDIKAAEGGKVVYSGSGLIGYGRLIIVKHNDNYLSAYGHNRDLLVSEGDQVTKGQKIAAMGRANNGKPLLHFEIRRNGKPVDPLRLLPRR